MPPTTPEIEAAYDALRNALKAVALFAYGPIAAKRDEVRGKLDDLEEEGDADPAEVARLKKELEELRKQYEAEELNIDGYGDRFATISQLTNALQGIYKARKLGIKKELAAAAPPPPPATGEEGPIEFGMGDAKILMSKNANFWLSCMMNGEFAWFDDATFLQGQHFPSYLLVEMGTSILQYAELYLKGGRISAGIDVLQAFTIALAIDGAYAQTDDCGSAPNKLLAKFAALWQRVARDLPKTPGAQPSAGIRQLEDTLSPANRIVADCRDFGLAVAKAEAIPRAIDRAIKVLQTAPAVSQSTPAVEAPPAAAEPTPASMTGKRAREDLVEAAAPSPKRAALSKEEQKALAKKEKELEKLRVRLAKKLATQCKRAKFTSPQKKPLAELREACTLETAKQLVGEIGQFQSDSARLYRRSLSAEDIAALFPSLPDTHSCKYTGKGYFLATSGPVNVPGGAESMEYRYEKNLSQLVMKVKLVMLA